jgi:hypothetical protein
VDKDETSFVTFKVPVNSTISLKNKETINKPNERIENQPINHQTSTQQATKQPSKQTNKQTNKTKQKNKTNKQTKQTNKKTNNKYLKYQAPNFHMH